MSNQVEVSLGIKNAPFKAGLAAARAEAQKFREDLRSEFAAALTFAGLAEAIKGTIEYGDTIADLSQRFGIGAESLQRWGNVAEENGASLEGVAKSMNKLIIAQDKALAGDEALRADFAALGVSIEDLKRLSPDELMRKIGGGSLKAAELVSVMGKSALELIPTLQAVADGTAEFGAVMDEATIETLGEASDRIKRISGTLRSWFGSALVFVTGLIGDMANTFGAAWGIIENKVSGMNWEDALRLGKEAYFRGQDADAEAKGKPARRARDTEEAATGAKDKARAAVEELAALKEKAAAAERSNIEQLQVLTERRVDLEERIEGLKAVNVDTLAEEIDLEKLKAQIVETSKKVEDEEVATMIRNAEVRERIAKLNEEAATIRRNALFEEMSTSQKINELQQRMAANIAEAKNADAERTAELQKQNAEMDAQLGKLRQVEQQERQAAMAKRVDQALKTPQERAAERRMERTRERVERTIAARDRQREADREKNAPGLLRVPSVPELLRRPADEAIRQLGDKVDMKPSEALLQRVVDQTDRILNKIGVGIR